MKNAGRHAAATAPSWAAWSLRFVVAFGLLNTLLTFENRWPGLGVRFGPRLSFELCFGLLVLTVLVAWRGRLASWCVDVLTVALGVLVLARYVDVTATAVYGRPLQFYWDGLHALDALQLARGRLAAWQIGAAVAAGLLGLALLMGMVRWCLRSLAEALVWHRPRPWLFAAGAALTLSFAAHPYVHRDTRWFFALPVSPLLWHQATMLPFWSSRSETRLAPSPNFDGAPAALGGADVLLIFAEAYGMSSFDDPDLAAALAAPRMRLRDRLQRTDWQVVSARVRSPTFGGGSWLAHAALLSGVDTQRPDDYERLLASRRPSLVSYFRQHGYRTVGWMPGLQRPWPEGAFYGFERSADAAAIGYRGPAFGYWRIPDQASMALLQAQELGRSKPRAPRFVVFPTVSSHAPFRPLAPYREDWRRLLEADAFGADEVEAALAEPVSWLAPRAAYAGSLAYTYEWLGAYLGTQAPEKLLVIVIGDHQPIASVTGPGASWDVPIHIIGRDRGLLARFAAAGFTAGLEPPVRSLGGMHQLTPLLLQTFDALPSVAGARH